MNGDFNIRGKNSDKEFENALRPLSFPDFNGQEKIVSNLKIFVQAARMRGESLDHTLLHGPPGLGKTTLSNIIANELGVGFKVTSGPVLIQTVMVWPSCSSTPLKGSVRVTQPASTRALGSLRNRG